MHLSISFCIGCAVGESSRAVGNQKWCPLLHNDEPFAMRELTAVHPLTCHRVTNPGSLIDRTSKHTPQMMCVSETQRLPCEAANRPHQMTRDSPPRNCHRSNHRAHSAEDSCKADHALGFSACASVAVCWGVQFLVAPRVLPNGRAVEEAWRRPKGATAGF